MNSFDYDAMMKKRIASQARNRKSKGGLHKGCSLPSDYLTAKQKRERNGIAVEYNMNAPVTWKEFKKFPKDLKEQYINNLKDTYGVTSAMICDMMGVIPGTLSRLIAKEGLNLKYSGRSKQTETQKKMWDLFLGNVTEDSSELPLRKIIESFRDTPAVLLPADVPPVEIVAEQVDDKPMEMNEFTIKFSGKLDVDSIMNSLRLILGRDSVGEISVLFTLQKSIT